MSLLSQVRTFAEHVRSYWMGPLSSRDPELAKWFGSAPTSTGLNITEEVALTYSAFWACVNAISTDVASVPLIAYKRLKEGGKERNTDAKLYRLLHDEPNPEMTAVSFRQMMTAHALTWGNGYAEIQRSGDGKPSALWPLVPHRVTPFRDPSGLGPIRYRVSRSDGGFDELPASEVLHIPGLGYDGVIGYSVVAKARESIGLGLAEERFGGSFYGNGTIFGGVLSHPGVLTMQVKDDIRKAIDARHQGVERAHRMLVLGGDAKFTQVGIPPTDAQFLESRMFQIEEMCRWFRMPPHKIAHLLRSTNNNIEHQGIEYYTDTMRPWCVRWEQECNRKLIPASERRIQFVEHLVDAVLRGDVASRYAAYAVGRQWGWLSADDVRERENMNPLPGNTGKIYLVPMNMTPADKIGKLVDAQIEAKNTPPQPPQPAPGEPEPDPKADADRAVAAIQAALAGAQERAEAHLTKAVALETEIALTKADAEVQKLAVEQERAAALSAAQEVAALKALQLEAIERADREKAERDASMADLARSLECAQTTIAALEIARSAIVIDAERLAELESQLLAVEQLRVKLADDLEAARASLSQAETQQQADRQRAISQVAANRALIVDAMARMVRRETEKARRNQATPAKLRAWAESFYLTHEETCLDALRPAMRAHLAAIGSAEDVDTVTKATLQPQLAAALEQIRIVAGGDPDEFPVTLERVLSRWEQDRPEALADLVLREEIDHV